ncbi:PREDICTED: glycosyltransferase 1 domain-containing protein 1-like [Priapulus caudatus]|uniref:Glycosyltransferase 1 domain-containing protein 1-like n=1 Tax=Priapulus caudatus TaxID=37621 RepID=A0ABM1ESH8_PRICU|nr:PREDICTED: glycosyltransferase 1 domain-containing protein 1-like [Priapulus caudatus]
MATDPETNYPLAILVLSPLKSFTGNLITAERIRKYFRNHRIFGFVKDPREFATLEAFHGFLELYQVATVIAIHAIHCGKLLQDCPVPYAVIFGGTDVNHGGVNADCFPMMTDVVINARKLVAFTDLMARQVLELWPDDISTDKIEVIPQGVKLNPSELFSISAHLKLVFSVTCEKPEIYMLVAGVRPVKDPLYLAEAFSDWHCSVNSKAYLVIVGPPLDEDYLNQFQAVVSRLPGVLFIPGLQHSDMQAAIRDSHALINSSRSEGQSVAILEVSPLTCNNHTLHLKPLRWLNW